MERHTSKYPHLSISERSLKLFLLLFDPDCPRLRFCKLTDIVLRALQISVLYCIVGVKKHASSVGGYQSSNYWIYLLVLMHLYNLARDE